MHHIPTFLEEIATSPELADFAALEADGDPEYLTTMQSELRALAERWHLADENIDTRDLRAVVDVIEDEWLDVHHAPLREKLYALRKAMWESFRQVRRSKFESEVLGCTVEEMFWFASTMGSGR